MDPLFTLSDIMCCFYKTPHIDRLIAPVQIPPIEASLRALNHSPIIAGEGKTKCICILNCCFVNVLVTRDAPVISMACG